MQHRETCHDFRFHCWHFYAPSDSKSFSIKNDLYPISVLSICCICVKGCIDALKAILGLFVILKLEVIFAIECSGFASAKPVIIQCTFSFLILFLSIYLNVVSSYFSSSFSSNLVSYQASNGVSRSVLGRFQPID